MDGNTPRDTQCTNVIWILSETLAGSLWLCSLLYEHPPLKDQACCAHRTVGRSVQIKYFISPTMKI